METDSGSDITARTTLSAMMEREEKRQHSEGSSRGMSEARSNTGVSSSQARMGTAYPYMPSLEGDRRKYEGETRVGGGGEEGSAYARQFSREVVEPDHVEVEATGEDITSTHHSVRASEAGSVSFPLSDEEELRLDAPSPSSVLKDIVEHTSSLLPTQPDRSFFSLLFEHDMKVVETLIMVLGGGSVSQDKAEAGQIAVLKLLHLLNAVPPSLAVLAMKDIEATTLAGEIMRTNSAATKLLATLLKTQCQPILRHSIVPIINAINAAQLSAFELPQSGEERNISVELIESLTSRLLNSVFASEAVIPAEVVATLSMVKDLANAKFPGMDAGLKAVAGSFFLRFFTPALVRPEAIANVDVNVVGEGRKMMMVVAKVVQNLANGVVFGPKEKKMAVFNNVISQNSDKCREFLLAISGREEWPRQKLQGTKEAVNALLSSLDGVKELMLDEVVASKLGQQLKDNGEEELFRSLLLAVADRNSTTVMYNPPLDIPPDVPEPMDAKDARKALKSMVANRMHAHDEGADMKKGEEKEGGGEGGEEEQQQRGRKESKLGRLKRALSRKKQKK